MRPSHHLRRSAVVGLAVTMLALTVLSLVGTVSIRRSTENVGRSAALATAYDAAHDAVAAEESLERKYRLEPDADVRAQHRRAGDDLNRALSDIRSSGGAVDRQLVETVQTLHDRLAAIVRDVLHGARA